MQHFFSSVYSTRAQTPIKTDKPSLVMHCHRKKVSIRDLPVVKKCFCIKDSSCLPGQSIRPKNMSRMGKKPLKQGHHDSRPARTVGITRVPENSQQRVLSEGARSPAMTAMGLKPEVGWLMVHVLGIHQSDQDVDIKQGNRFGHQASSSRN